MYKLLQEINSINTERLSEVQKIVLCSIAGSKTPQLALDSVYGSVYTVEHASLLKQSGMLNITNNGITITNKGYSVMEANDLIDTLTGELTDSGKQFAEKIQDIKLQFDL